MSKEMERLKSKMEYCEILINVLDSLNFTSDSNKHDKIIEEYRKRLSELCIKFQELKKEENK